MNMSESQVHAGKVKSTSIKIGKLYDGFHTPFIALDEKCNLLSCNAEALSLLAEDDSIYQDSDNPVNFTNYLVKSTKDFLSWFYSDAGYPIEILLLCDKKPTICIVYRDKRNRSQYGDVTHLALLVVSGTKRIADELNIHKLAFVHSPQAIYVTNNQGIIITVNPAFCELFSCTERHALGRTDSRFYSQEFNQSLRDNVLNEIKEKEVWRGRVKVKNTDGKEFISLLTASRVPAKIECESNYVYIIEDIGEQLRIEAELKAAAEIDALTGLINRLGFNDIYEKRFYEAQRQGESLAVFFIDLDKFKYLNDHYGHEYGDLLLQHVGGRLLSNLKSTDIVARLGGDEFAVVMNGIEGKDSVAGVARKLVEALEKPFKLGDLNYQCTSSIGIARYPLDATTREELLGAADSAMYLAKKEGRNQFRHYDQSAHALANSTSKLIKEVEEALLANKVQAYYQPIHNMVTKQVVGFEALSRLEDSSGAIRNGHYFLPTIKNDPLLIQLGIQIAGQVYQQASIFRRNNISIPLSMNLSSLQLRSEELISNLEARYSGKNADLARQINIEIANTDFGEDVSTYVGIQRLKKLGFNFVLDNFGANQASLSTLKKLDFHSIKIDRQFIKDVQNGDYQDRSFLLGIIYFLKSLEVRIVCEGVETVEQSDFLIGSGCLYGQGHYYAEPLNRSALFRYATDHNATPY